MEARPQLGHKMLIVNTDGEEELERLDDEIYLTSVLYLLKIKDEGSLRTAFYETIFGPLSESVVEGTVFDDDVYDDEQFNVEEIENDPDELMLDELEDDEYTFDPDKEEEDDEDYPDPMEITRSEMTEEERAENERMYESNHERVVSELEKDVDNSQYTVVDEDDVVSEDEVREDDDYEDPDQLDFLDLLDEFDEEEDEEEEESEDDASPSVEEDEDDVILDEDDEEAESTLSDESEEERGEEIYQESIDELEREQEAVEEEKEEIDPPTTVELEEEEEKSNVIKELDEEEVPPVKEDDAEDGVENETMPEKMDVRTVSGILDFSLMADEVSDDSSDDAVDSEYSEPDEYQDLVVEEDEQEDDEEELPELDANQITSAESDRQVALDVLKRKRNFENNVLQAALEHSDARAEGGFPTVNSDDLAALDRLTKKVQIGPTGIQIDENAPDEIMSEVARLDLIRTRMARARNLKHAPDKRIPFELSDLLCALGFLTYSRERTLPNINLVPNRYVYRKLRLMVLGVLFRADCPLNSKSEGKLSEALGPSKRVRREIEYDFSAALDQVEHLQTLFKFAGLGDLFQTMQGKRSNEDLRMEIGDLPDLTLDPEHFFPVKGQAPVYVPLLTNIINWLSVPGPITLSANAVNEAVALFCQLHLSHAEDLALGRDLPKMVRLVDELEVSRAESEQFRREVEAAAQAAKQYHQAENQAAAAPEQAAELDLTQFFGSDSEEPEQANAESQDTPEDGARSEQALAPAEAGADASADASTEAGADASVPETPAHKSPAAVHGLFIYDEDTERDPELEAQALSELNAKDGAQADSAAPADSAAQADAAAPVLQVLTPIAGKEHASIAEQFGISWDDDTTRMLQRAHDLSLYDESWRGVNFSTRPIEDDNQARNVVQKALSSDSIDLPKALLEVASAQVRRHHNLTIYTPGSAIVIEFALAKNEEQLSQITSMALHNLVHVDSPLQTALGKSSYELETTQVQRVLLVGLVQGRRIVVRKVLVVDVNPATAEF